MAPPFALPPSPPAGNDGWPGRLRDYLLKRWRGRLLLAAVLVVVLAEAGLPLPFLDGLSRVLIGFYALVGGVRLVAHVLRRLLWRIRTKLILSYLFIALVPAVLLTSFFLIATILLVNLVAAHLVTAEIDGIGQTLQAEARMSLAGLPATDPVPALRERLGRVVTARHPGLAFSFLERGRVLASSGGAPESLPGWWKDPGFAGLVEAENGERLRAAWREGDRALVLEIPVDRALFAELERRMGIHLLTSGGRVSRIADSKGLRIEVHDEKSTPFDLEQKRSGFAFVATPERVDWKTGKRELDALTFQFEPWELAAPAAAGQPQHGGHARGRADRGGGASSS